MASPVQELTYVLSADSTDENPGNNTVMQSFEVTDLQYGRDNGIVTANFPGDGTDDYIAMPLYDIINDVTIYAIDVAIMDGSEDGTPIRGFLVDMFDDLALTEQYGGELISSAEVDMASRLHQQRRRRHRVVHPRVGRALRSSCRRLVRCGV